MPLRRRLACMLMLPALAWAQGENPHEVVPGPYLKSTVCQALLMSANPELRVDGSASTEKAIEALRDFRKLYAREENSLVKRVSEISVDARTATATQRTHLHEQGNELLHRFRHEHSGKKEGFYGFHREGDNVTAFFAALQNQFCRSAVINDVNNPFRNACATLRIVGNAALVAGGHVLTAPLWLAAPAVREPYTWLWIALSLVSVADTTLNGLLGWQLNDWNFGKSLATIHDWLNDPSADYLGLSWNYKLREGILNAAQVSDKLSAKHVVEGGGPEMLPWLLPLKDKIIRSWGYGDMRHVYFDFLLWRDEARVPHLNFFVRTAKEPLKPLNPKERGPEGQLQQQQQLQPAAAFAK